MFDGKRIDALEECCKEYRARSEEMSGSFGELTSELKLLRLHIEKHKETFEKHDEAEMEKYDAIRESISKMSGEITKFNRIFWVVIGAVAVMNFLGITESVKHIIRSGLEQNYRLGEQAVINGRR